MNVAEAAQFFLSNWSIPRSQRLHLYCEPRPDGSFLVGWCHSFDNIVATELVHVCDGVIEEALTPHLRNVDAQFLHEQPDNVTYQKQIADLRQEVLFLRAKVIEFQEETNNLRVQVREGWNAARSAAGQTEAFRILENMVDRVGYGRPV